MYHQSVAITGQDSRRKTCRFRSLAPMRSLEKSCTKVVLVWTLMRIPHCKVLYSSHVALSGFGVDVTGVEVGDFGGADEV